MEKLVNIISSIQRRPLYAYFSEPVTYEGTTETLSLDDLKSDLIEGRVSRMNEFENIMDQWFDLNREKLEDEEEKASLNELERGYKRSLSKLKEPTKTWREKCIELNGKVKLLMKYCPSCVDSRARRTFSQSEVDRMIQGIRQISSPADIFRICKILEKDPSHVKLNTPELTVDLTTLEYSTVARLRSFMSRIPIVENARG